VSVPRQLSDLLAFPQQTGEQRAAPAPPTQHATSREQPHQLALSALAVVVIVLLVVVIVLLPAIAQEMSQQGTAEAAAPQHATGNQETQDPAVITVIVLVRFAWVRASLPICSASTALKLIAFAANHALCLPCKPARPEYISPYPVSGIIPIECAPRARVDPLWTIALQKQGGSSHPHCHGYLGLQHLNLQIQLGGDRGEAESSTKFGLRNAGGGSPGRE